MSRTDYSILSMTFLITLLLCSCHGHAEDWPSLRGPRHDGSGSAGDSELASGSLQLNVAWKQPVGSGYSGIVKIGNRLVSAMADAEAGQEFVIALSAETGDPLWKTPTGNIMKGANGSFDGPVATPAADNDRAYHLSPFGDLAAYSLTDGSVLWSHNLTEKFSVTPNFYGFGASPVIHAGVLIVVTGSPDGAVMGFDPETGKVLWRAGKDEAAFQSALPIQIGDRAAVIAAGNTTLFAIDVSNGDIIWSQPHGGAKGMPAWSVIPVPLKDGGIFIGDQREGSTALDISLSEGSERWSGREIRNTYCVPVISGGALCSYSSRFLTAVDPATGERLWRARRPGNGFLATMAGRLVAATLDGSLHIGDVSREGFDEVAAIKVFESGAGGGDGLMWSLPSVAGRSVYLRSLGAIARVDVQPADRGMSLASQASEVAPGFKTFLSEVQSSDDKQTTINRYLKGKTMPLIEGDYVHFMIQGDYEDVAVASELFGVRQERVMQRVEGTNLFYFGTRVPDSTRVSYVFYADYQPLVDPLNKQTVVSTTLTGEMEPSFMGPGKMLEFSWFDKGLSRKDLPGATDNPPAKLAGSIEQTSLESAAVKSDVQLSVYLPPGYSESDHDHPVVFVHEGQVAMESGNQAAIVDELIRTKTIRPVVVVFIHWRFYPLLGANGYPQMFSGELLPMIMKRYRISENRNDRASLSGGFGATLALLGTLPASHQFARIGCHSPFAFEMLHPMINQMTALPGERCKVRIDWGRYEFRNPSENWNMASQSQAIAKMLKKGGHQVTAEQTSMGSDWVCWRTQSEQMWAFLVGK